MKLQVPIYPSDVFTWSKNSGVTDMSDLNPHIYDIQPWKQLYDDACDVGFGIQSTVTGKVVIFFMGKIDRDGDGDICGWNFLSECGNYKILVVND